MSVQETIDRVLAGDVDAFAGLVRRYQQEVWRIAAYALRDAAATEDLVQQVFVRAYFHLSRLERGRDPGPWIRTIARNEARRAIRDGARDARKRRLYGDFLAMQLDRTAEADDLDEELRRGLRRCREELSPAAQEALQLRYEQALGFDRIAEALGRTVAAARQLLSRTRIALRRCIEKQRKAAHT